ncbi:MAG: DUF2314 domain-containing protein [Myxococcaceae bacterium]
MNQRGVAIAIVVLFAVCFVGSCTAGVFQLVKTAADGMEVGKKRDPFASTNPTPKDSDDSDLPPSDPLNVPPTGTDDDDSPPTGAPNPADPLGGAYDPPVLATAQFAVFHVTKAKADGWKTLQKLAKAAKLNAYQNDAPDEAEPPYLVFRSYGTDEYEVIGGDTLTAARGLNEKEQKALQGAKDVSVVDVILPLGKQALFRESIKVMAELQKATGGVLWDQEAEEYLSAAEWKKRRLDTWEKDVPDAPLHFTMFVDTKTDTVDLNTGGLAHFGLPELKLAGVPVDKKNLAEALINLTAQLMAEGAFEPDLGRVTVRIDEVKHKVRRDDFASLCTAEAHKELEFTLVNAGTLTNPALTFSFNGAGTKTARIAAALDTLFGPDDDEGGVVGGVTGGGDDDDDGEAKTAPGLDPKVAAVAKKQLDAYVATVKPRYLKGFKKGEALEVKAPFPTDLGGTSYAWVEVRKLTGGDMIIGVLAETPKGVSDLKKGDEVSLVEEELIDWRTREGKKVTGGDLTGPLMKK